MRTSHIIPGILFILGILSVALGAGVSLDGDSIRREGHKRILVLVSDSTAQSSHSLLVGQLKGMGGTTNRVTVSRLGDPSLRLTEYGEYVCDVLVLLAPRGQYLQGKVSPKAIASFVDDGGSLLLVAPSVTDGAAFPADGKVRDLAKELGVSLSSKAVTVVDHFNVEASDDADGADHSTITIDPSAGVVAGSTIAGGPWKKGSPPIVYRGTSLKLTDRNNMLIHPVLRASPTAYEHRIDSSAPPGDGLLLVTAMQARNNARVVVAGGMNLLSDRYFGMRTGSGSPTSNMALSGHLVNWLLHESGSLRLRDVRHHKDGEDSTAVYRINDNLHFSMVVEEFSNGEWVPFKADDIQLEWTMLDPYIRTRLTHDGKGKYTTSFRVPDTYGTFKIVVDHRRQGLSYLYYTEQVTVRPFRHNEFERFIPAAYPYYANAFALMGAFFVLGLVFLYSADKGGKAKSD